MNRIITLAAALAALLPGMAHGAGKVLFVNSYHQGYAWSDGEETGARQALAGSGVTLDFFRMDTKRNPDPKFLEEQGRKVKALIDAEKPDVVIASDDNAVRVMAKYFKNAKLPWVYCGVNWDPANHGLPFKNVTGMTEVGLVAKIMDALKVYGKGTRLGYLTSDNETERTEGRAYAKHLKLKFAEERYVKTFAEWKEQFARMQGEVDVLFLGNNAGINDWNEAEAVAFVLANGKIPTGAMYDWMMPYAMLGMTKVAEEQGIFAGKAAAQILKGTSPASIPPTENRNYDLYLNVKVASRAGVLFRPELLKNAKVIK